MVQPDLVIHIVHIHINLLIHEYWCCVQVVGSAERLVERLRRLDEVLPRYQRLAAGLFETLRVRALDEVLPALRARLQA